MDGEVREDVSPEEQAAVEEQAEETVEEESVEEQEQEDSRYDDLSARLDSLEDTLNQALDMIATLSIGEETPAEEEEADVFDDEYGDAVELDDLDRVLGR